MLQSLSDRPDDGALRTTICEGVDAVFLSLHYAIESDDDELWPMAKKLVDDRSDLMSNIRRTYRQSGQPLDEAARARIVEITNTVEQIFFSVQVGPGVGRLSDPVHVRPGEPTHAARPGR